MRKSTERIARPPAPARRAIPVALAELLAVAITVGVVVGLVLLFNLLVGAL